MSKKMVLFGIDMLSGEGHCSGRPGIVEIRGKDGSWSAFCKTGSMDGDGEIHEHSTMVCDCEHEAAGVVAYAMTELIKHAIEEHGSDPIKALLSLPKPSDFRYTYVDQEPAEIEVTDTSDADSVLASIGARK